MMLVAPAIPRAENGRVLDFWTRPSMMSFRARRIPHPQNIVSGSRFL